MEARRCWYAVGFGSWKVELVVEQPVEALTERLRALRARNSELAVAIEDEELTGPSPEELDALSARIGGAIDHGPITLLKAVLQELVAGVRGETGGSFGRPSGSRFAGS